MATRLATMSLSCGVPTRSTLAHIEFDVWVGLQKGGQAGQNEMPGERAMHIDPQHALRLGAGKGTLSILDIG
jgi:hypothetical protein